MDQAAERGSWFSWHKAAQTLEKVKENITITADHRSVRHLPRESPDFCKKARETCENIMKGLDVQTPGGYDPFVHRLSSSVEDLGNEHPYLKKM